MNSIVPAAKADAGLAPIIAAPCIGNIKIANGIENADGIAMIPANSQNWFR
jgi:hypothetical protein